MHTHHSGQKIQKSLIFIHFFGIFKVKKKIVNSVKRDFFDWFLNTVLFVKTHLFDSFGKGPKVWF